MGARSLNRARTAVIPEAARAMMLWRFLIAISVTASAIAKAMMIVMLNAGVKNDCPCPEVRFAPMPRKYGGPWRFPPASR